MKKFLTLLLCILLIAFSLTACSKASGTAELTKTVFGLSEEEACMAFEVSDKEVEIIQNEGSYMSSAVYTYYDVSFGGEKCNLVLTFSAYGSGEYTLMEYQCYFDDQESADRVYDDLIADKEYVDLGMYQGYCTNDSLYTEDTEWIETYTKVFLGEQGIYMGRTNSEYGVDYRVDSNCPAEEEKPLITITQKATEKPSINVGSTVYHILSQKAIFEEWYPDGIPTAE